MKKILLATNGSGFQIDKCFEVLFFKESIDIIISDRECNALDIAKKHGIKYININEKKSVELNSKIIQIAQSREIDYIISPGFTRIFTNDLLQEFPQRVFNCHPSILPAFKGFYDTHDVKRTYHPRKIFERTIEFGSRVTGTTIHLITENVDEGYPVIVSNMNIPFREDVKYTRHRLFVQECKSLLQLVSWLNQDRIHFDGEGYPFVKDAQYSRPGFSPNLEDLEVINFDLEYPWDSKDQN